MICMHVYCVFVYVSCIVASEVKCLSEGYDTAQSKGMD